MRKREIFESGSPTVQYINKLLARHSEYSQDEIAQNSGFTSSRGNILTQIKSGRSKMPMSKIVPMCTFLGEDPREFFFTAMKEYFPEIFAALNDVVGLCVTEDEHELLVRYRERKKAMKIGLSKNHAPAIKRLKETDEANECLDSILKSA